MLVFQPVNSFQTAVRFPPAMFATDMETHHGMPLAGSLALRALAAFVLVKLFVFFSQFAKAGPGRPLPAVCTNFENSWSIPLPARIAGRILRTYCIVTYFSNAFTSDIEQRYGVPLPARVVVREIGLVIFTKLWLKVPPFNARSDAPPSLPYLFPWIGHTLSFMLNAEQVFSWGSDEFGLRPWTLMIGGKKQRIITHPEDVKTIERSQNFVSHDENSIAMVGKIYDVFDKPNVTVLELFEGGTNPEGDRVIDVRTFIRRSLSGDALAILIQRSTDELERILNREYENAREAGGSLLLRQGLTEWCKALAMEAVTNAAMGPGFLKAYPNIVKRFWAFDRGHHRLMYQGPKIFVRKTLEAREALFQAFAFYYSDAGAKLREGGHPFILNREEEWKRIGLNLSERVRANMALFHALHANIAPVSCWMMLHTVLTPGYLPRIVDEVTPGFTQGAADVALINSTKSCPLLNSVFNEVLRSYSNTFAFRVATDRVENVGGYTLLKGDKVLMPSRPVHMSKELWGDNARNFDMERFLDHPELANSPNMRVFGASKLICPGRALGTAMSKAFVAGALMRFDFQFADAEIPGPDLTAPPVNGSIAKPAVSPKLTLASKKAWKAANAS